MATPAEALWEINNEYRKRLSLLMGHLKLLEQLLIQQPDTGPTLRMVLRNLRAMLEDADADHHTWRHTYYYQAGDDVARRRMVDDPAAVRRALTEFTVMLSQHTPQFVRAYSMFTGLPRPPEHLTRLVKDNDLWAMCLTELQALVFFDRFVAGVLETV
ncbi:MAG: hypothetical protein Kow0077_29930 [Anaerolineae bacterium]